MLWPSPVVDPRLLLAALVLISICKDFWGHLRSGEVSLETLAIILAGVRTLSGLHWVAGALDSQLWEMVML